MIVNKCRLSDKYSVPAATASVTQLSVSDKFKPEVAMSELTPIYRVDKFIVPESSRNEFLSKIFETHRILRTQPGFLQDSILEQTDGPGKYNIVTVAEWKNQESIDAAKKVVQEEHEKNGFSPQKTMQRLGVEADIANYKSVSA